MIVMELSASGCHLNLQLVRHGALGWEEDCVSLFSSCYFTKCVHFLDAYVLYIKASC